MFSVIRRKYTHHVTAQLCGCHSREIWCASVVFATANDGYTSQLTCKINQIMKCSSFASYKPLWKLSSIGGIILYTLLISSFLDAEAIVRDVDM